MKKTILILIVAMVCCFKGHSPPLNNDQKANMIFEFNKYAFYLTVFDKPFSPELLKQAMFFEKISNPEIVFIQAQLETGNFTSDLFVNANNLFGMRLARSRDTYACFEYKYHASYKTWLSCVKDMALWQKYWAGKGYDLTDYFAFLEDIEYATDKNYLSKIKAMS